MSRSVAAANTAHSFQVCPGCLGSGWVSTGDGIARCAFCNQAFSDASFQAHGADAMDAQTTIVTEHIRASSRVKLTQNILAGAFVIIAGLCVLFAPDGRALAAEIVALAFLVVGAGIAGFANLRVRIPHVELNASGQQLPVTKRQKSPPKITSKMPSAQKS